MAREMKGAIRDMNGFYTMDRWWEVGDLFSIERRLGIYMYSYDIDSDYEDSWQIHIKIEDYLKDII